MTHKHYGVLVDNATRAASKIFSLLSKVNSEVVSNRGNVIGSNGRNTATSRLRPTVGRNLSPWLEIPCQRRGGQCLRRAWRWRQLSEFQWCCARAAYPCRRRPRCANHAALGVRLVAVKNSVSIRAGRLAFVPVMPMVVSFVGTSRNACGREQ